MTSSYLEKPRRELEQVLKERGISKNDIVGDTVSEQESSSNILSFSRGNSWYLLGLCALVIFGGVAAVIVMPVDDDGNRTLSTDINAIEPAAGAEQPAMDNSDMPDGMPTVPESGTLQPK